MSWNNSKRHFNIFSWRKKNLCSAEPVATAQRQDGVFHSSFNLNQELATETFPPFIFRKQNHFPLSNERSTKRKIYVRGRFAWRADRQSLRYIKYGTFSFGIRCSATAVAAASPLELSADDGKVRRRPEDGGMTLITRNKDKWTNPAAVGGFTHQCTQMILKRIYERFFFQECDHLAKEGVGKQILWKSSR